MSSVSKAATSGATAALKKVVGHWAFWLVVAVLLLIIIVKSKGAIETWWRNLNRTNRADTSGQQLNAEDQARVKQIARDLFTAIHSWTNADREEMLLQAVALNATELRYLAEEYAALNDGTSLLQDLQDELTLPDVGEMLIARLNEVGAPL